MCDAGFYDRTYYEAHGKSNYDGYTIDSSPFAQHADTIIAMMAAHGLDGPVLDIGCAKGYLVYVLRQRGVEAFGVDWSDYALSSANDDVHPYLLRASATDLPLADGAFAMAVSFDLMEHLDEPSARLAMRESSRVAARQLHQINTGRRPEWRYDGDDSHCLQLPLERWRAMAVEQDLSTMDVCEPDRQLPIFEGASMP